MKKNSDTSPGCKLLPKRASFTGTAGKRRCAVVSGKSPEHHRTPGELFPRIISRVALWIAVLLLIVILFFDQLAFWAVTTIGSQIIGAKISMDDLEISLTRGDVKITNLQVASPDGFNEETMIEVSSLYLKVEKSSLFSDETIISDIEVRQINIYGLITENGDFNIQKFADRMRELQSRENNDGKLILKNILLERLKIHISDQRPQKTLNGFVFSLEKFSGTIHSGDFYFEALSINSPHQKNINLLELDRAAITFAANSITNGSPEISSVDADGLRVSILPETFVPYIRETSVILHELFTSPEKVQSGHGTMPIGNFNFKNSSWLIRDKSNENSEYALGINLHEISGNWNNGSVMLDSLLITSPQGYQEKMLQLRSAQISFVPASLFSNTPEFKNIRVENLCVTAGIKNREHTNIGVAINILRRLFAPAAPEGNSSEINPFIDNFEIVNASITVNDYRPGSTGNINGLGVSFKKMSGSWDKGHIALDSLSVNNPEGYSDYMLQIKTLIMDFDPASLAQATTLIDNIQVDSLHATACISENGDSNFRDVKTAVELLFFPLISDRSASSDDTATAASIPMVRIAGYCLENCKFTIRDTRADAKANGVNFYLRKICYSQLQRIWQLTDMRTINPPGYTKPYIATVDSISVAFPEQQSPNRDLIIDQLIIDGAHVFAEYNQNGELNAHHIADALCIIFEGNSPCQQGASAPQIPEEAPVDPEPPKIIIRHYQLKDSSFSLWDAKTRVPLRVPLQQDETDYTLERNGGSTFESLHSQTVKLGDKLAEVTDARSILIYLLNETAGSGINLLLKTGDSGIQIFRNMFDSLL